MDVEEYNAERAVLVAALVDLFLKLFRPLRAPQIQPPEWAHLLDVLYPSVVQTRIKVAELSRRFYDSQREISFPDQPRHDTMLPHYEPAWFREAMEPARRALSQPGASDGALSQGALRVAKEAENAGRRTILRAVDSDPVVKGWARVATGRETCGFCMMLVSRGPVYFSAEDAGLNLNDTSAAELWQLAESGDDEAKVAMDQMMKRWHPGCDCAIVPVFDTRQWPGRDSWKEAERAWIKYTSGQSGRDALNAFRRAIENGALNPRDFAVAA